MAKGRNRGKANIPKDESKADRFVRVVTPRVGKAIKAISVIGYCSGASYEFTPSQVEQICDTLRKAIEGMASKFSSKPEAQSAFEFKK